MPVPLLRVTVQLVSAPVMLTVPVGVVEPPATVTETATVAPDIDGLGVCELMVVVFAATTWCDAVMTLVEWVESPL